MSYPYSVNPTKIPEHMSNPQLEYFILFGILVAGKGAIPTAAKLDAFLEKHRDADYLSPDVYLTPFEIVKELIYFHKLGEELYAAKFGQYSRIDGAFREAVNLDVEHLTLEALEAVPGIGPKTARMVILYSDPNAQVVPLDTHILKYLGSLGYKVPSTTPPAGKVYRYLEAEFIKLAKRRSMTVRQLDTLVWKSYATPAQES